MKEKEITPFGCISGLLVIVIPPMALLVLLSWIAYTSYRLDALESKAGINSPEFFSKWQKEDFGRH